MAARIAYEFRACRTMDWCAASMDMIAFINSSGSAGECMNCSLVFAAAARGKLGWARRAGPVPRAERRTAIPSRLGPGPR